MQTPAWLEKPIIIDCEGDRLLAIITQPPTPHETGVVIIVGGPQYRAGSHRQFTLLARHLAEHGIASIRFDYRGMGDSEGEMRNFENIDADIRAAIDALIAHTSGVQRVALWGLCDAASASLYYAHGDPRVHSYYWTKHGRSAVMCPLNGTEIWRTLRRPEFAELSVR